MSNKQTLKNVLSTLQYQQINFDYVITVCDNAKEQCPIFPAVTNQVHKSFPDPAKAEGTEAEIMNQFKHTRNLIRDFCQKFTERIKQ